jgi:hypothetical protein
MLRPTRLVALHCQPVQAVPPEHGDSKYFRSSCMMRFPLFQVRFSAFVLMVAALSMPLRAADNDASAVPPAKADAPLLGDTPAAAEHVKRAPKPGRHGKASKLHRGSKHHGSKAKSTGKAHKTLKKARK